jgi:hypothetical protein
MRSGRAMRPIYHETRPRYKLIHLFKPDPNAPPYVTCSRAKPAMRLYSSESRWSSARVM